MGWKRILSQKRPAAGGEARERASFLYQDGGRRLDPAQSRGWILHFGLERVGFCTKLRSDFVFWTEKVGSCTKSGRDFAFWLEKVGSCTKLGADFAFWLEKVGSCTKSGSDFAFWEEKGRICKIWGNPFLGIKKD